jgi:hypothetical protein
VLRKAAASLLASEGGYDKDAAPDVGDRKSAITAVSPCPEPARAGDDDKRAKHLDLLIDAAGEHWDDPQALLARVLRYADRNERPSRGLCADIEIFLSCPWPMVYRREEGSARG